MLANWLTGKLAAQGGKPPFLHGTDAQPLVLCPHTKTDATYAAIVPLRATETSSSNISHMLLLSALEILDGKVSPVDTATARCMMSLHESLHVSAMLGLLAALPRRMVQFVPAAIIVGQGSTLHPLSSSLQSLVCLVKPQPHGGSHTGAESHAPESKHCMNPLPKRSYPLLHSTVFPPSPNRLDPNMSAN
jgi:hypothetical protein